MKKFLALLLIFVLACSVATSFAEETTASESKFETVLLKKGSLLLKEWIDCCQVRPSRSPFSMTFQRARVIDIETGEKFYALRLEYVYSNSSAIGVMDADEIDGAIATLEYIKNHIYELKDYSEVIYTASSGVEVGGYHTDALNEVFIKLNSNDIFRFDMQSIDELINAFKGVRVTFALR